MNDLISQLSPTPAQNQAQGASQTKGTGRRDNPRNDTGNSFSSMVSKASERKTEGSASYKGKKADDVKPAEELVAYAAATQAANNPAQVDNTTAADTAVQETAPVADAASAAETAAVNYSPIEILTPILGGEDANAAIELLGIDAGESLTPEQVPDFLNKLLAFMEEQSGGEETIAAPDAQAEYRAAFQRKMEQINQAFINIAAVPAVTVNALEAAQTEITPVSVTVAAVLADDIVQTNEGVKTEAIPLAVSVSDDTAEAVLPVEQQDTDMLERIRAKLAAHVAAMPNAEDSAKAPAEAAPEVLTTVADDAPAAAATEEVAVQADTEEQPVDKKAEVKKSETPIHDNTAIGNTSVNRAESAAVEQPQTDVKVQTRNIIDQIVQSARLSKTDGTSQLEIQLRPEHLGKVSIVLTSGEDGVNARIKANSDTVRAMLSGGLGDLMTSLKEMGVNMKNIDVVKPELNWDYTRNQSQQQFSRDGQNNGNKEQSKPQGRMLRISNPRVAQISSALYETATLRLTQDENTSVDFIA